MPSNRWAVCRGLPIGILGKTYSQPWGRGCTLSEQFSCRLQMSRAWQPSVPLKRKDLDVFGDSPLSLRGWKKKIKTWKLLPDSFARVLPAQDSRQLYILSIIWDHMWKFWSLTFLFLSLRPKRLVSHPNCRIKKARVASKACRQKGDKREGGRSWRLGKGTELVQVPSVSPLWLPWSLPVSFTKAPPLSPQDLQNPLTLTICISSPWRQLRASTSINRDLNSKLLEDIGSFASKIIFFSAFGIIFLALGALAIFLQQICKLIFIERITTSQRGFTENQPRGTNPISPSQNGNQAVNWKDAKLWSTLVSGGHLFPNRNI